MTAPYMHHRRKWRSRAAKFRKFVQELRRSNRIKYEILKESEKLDQEYGGVRRFRDNHEKRN